MLTCELATQWIFKSADILSEKKDYLTALDAAIGDADHGLNMHRGFNKVKDKLEENPSETLEGLFKLTGMTLLSSVGGVSGPLYGTLFIKFSQYCENKDELSLEELFTLFERGVEGVSERGKAQLEDKTMLDVLIPVSKVLKSALNENLSFEDFCAKVVDVAEDAMNDTVGLRAKKGRASYLGERSVGHQDPGATSSYYLIKTLMETLVNND